MDARFSILTFLQHFDGARLHLRVLVVPRLGAGWNGDPLLDTPFELAGALASGPPFTDADLRLEARVLDGLGRFPARGPADAVEPLPEASGLAPSARALLAALTAPGPGRFRVSPAPPAMAPEPEPGLAIKKYLPETYRSAFLFTGPRTPGAVTDDSYHCAIRAAVVPNPAFVTSPDTVSWGEVYAFCLRQPALAKQLGLIRTASFAVPAGRLAGGGFVYVDLAGGSAYADQAAADFTVLARYAARVPRLTAGAERPLFAAVLFPVLNAPAVPTPLGDYDAVFADAAAYDAGFARVVHAQQAPSQSLLAEAPNGFPPTTDVGVRLAWDDEQVLAWHNRQLSVDPTVPKVAGVGQRLDAPTGVFGYHVDVRRAEADAPKGPWRSLVHVRSRALLTVDDIPIGDAPFDGELPVEVHPMRLDGTSTQYWLPPYFTQWNGTSLVLPDADAARVYRTTDPAHPTPATLGQLYEPIGLGDVPLRYGRRYEFRVRLADVTGGGPAFGDPTLADAESPVAAVHFVRHVPPEQPRVPGLPRFGATPTDERYFPGDALAVPRPLLGYPSAVFTGKYADPVSDLVAAAHASGAVDSTGVPDPDVRRVRIDVEVRTLRFDNAGSGTGQENFLPLYTTRRDYPADVHAPCDVPFEFRDARVLRFGDAGDLGDLGLTHAAIDAMPQLPLPRARELRLTIRAESDDDPAYWATGAHVGRPVRFLVRRESTDETGLLEVTTTARTVRGIYLQPDPLVPWDQSVDQLLLQRTTGDTPAAIARLAEQVGCACKGLTLVGRPGERVVFGCARGLRHTLAPDNSSITFAAKDDLIGHWVVPLTVRLQRDWTWDALKTVAVEIARTRADGYQTAVDGTPAGGADVLTEPRRVVGDWEIPASVPIQALQDPQRDHTTLVFFDAVAPFPAGVADPTTVPQEIALAYDLTLHFRQTPAPASDPRPIPLALRLPATTAPSQVPRIVAAGLALSPYVRAEEYASTEPRRRRLWIELDEPVRDPRDACFVRQLGYAPDPLVSDDRVDTFAPPEEPALGLDPELVRVVGPGQADDRAGFAAMTPLEPGLDAPGGSAGRFFVVPLPPGLDPSSRELFGFFTYEFRVGHATVWSTAQARFGRPLRSTGVQHPAPTLFCTVRRDADALVVEAPYAEAVFDGRNVTADPPRTSLWALLYAQVRQADGQDWRNVLLDDGALDPIPRERRTTRDARSDALVLRQAAGAVQGGGVLRDLLAGSAGLGTGVSAATVRQSRAFANRDAPRRGAVRWTQPEIAQLLDALALPGDARLSVLCVEVMPTLAALRQGVRDGALAASGAVADRLARYRAGGDVSTTVQTDDGVRPLSTHLGEHRILRTSPLTAVPEVCCATC